MKHTISRRALFVPAACTLVVACSGCVTAATVQSEIDTALQVVSAARAAGADQCDRVTMTAADAELERAQKALAAEQRYPARVHARAVLTLTRGTRRTLGPDGQCSAAAVAPAPKTTPAAEPAPAPPVEPKSEAPPVDPAAGAPPLP